MTLPRSTPEEQGVDPRAVLAMLDALDRPELHSLMVLRHGNVVAEGWAHPYAADRPHQLYSLSKTFTATAIGFAAAEGLLGLDDLVVRLLPDEAPAAPDEKLAKLTVRHLLTMSSGHDPEPDVLHGDGDWVAAFLATPLVHEPGSTFVYSTATTHVLSAIVQRVTGQPLLDYLGPRLLEPLGIVGATSEVSPTGVALGGTGISVRTEDIAAFGQLYRQDGMWQGRRLLPEGWVALASAPHIASTGDSPDWQQGYGFQMWRSRHGYRMDGAFGQFALVLPDEDVVVAITGAFADTSATLNAVWDHLLPGLGRPLPSDREAREALTERLAGLRLDPPRGLALTDTARRLTRRTITFEDNPLGLVSVAFAAAGVADELVVRWTGGAVTLHPGHDEPVPQHLTNPIRPRESRQALVSGTWTGPDRYVLTVRFVESVYVWTVTADVDGDRVTVTPRVNVSFGPTQWPPVAGSVAE